MRNRIANMAQTAHGALQPVQHVIHALGQLIKLITHTPHGDAGPKVSVLNFSHNLIQAGHGAANIAADQETASQAQKDNQGPGPPYGPDDLKDEGFAFADIETNKQGRPIAQPHLLAPASGLYCGAIRIGLGEFKAGIDRVAHVRSG